MVDAVTAPTSTDDLITRAQQLLSTGAISQAQFDALKAAAQNTTNAGKGFDPGVKTPDYGNSGNSMQKFGQAVTGIGQNLAKGLSQGFNQQPTSPGPVAGGTYDSAGVPAAPGWDY